MRIPVALVADEANVSREGKLNVLGAFDRISVAAFPAVHPKMTFVFQLRAEEGDAARPVPLRVRLVDEEENDLWGTEGEIAPPAVAAGEVATANQIVALVGVRFPAPGRYRFVVEVGDLPPHETPLLVQETARDPSLN